MTVKDVVVFFEPLLGFVTWVMMVGDEACNELDKFALLWLGL